MIPRRSLVAEAQKCNNKSVYRCHGQYKSSWKSVDARKRDPKQDTTNIEENLCSVEYTQRENNGWNNIYWVLFCMHRRSFLVGCSRLSYPIILYIFFCLHEYDYYLPSKLVVALFRCYVRSSIDRPSIICRHPFSSILQHLLLSFIILIMHGLALWRRTNNKPFFFLLVQWGKCSIDIVYERQWGKTMRMRNGVVERHRDRLEKMDQVKKYGRVSMTKLFQMMSRRKIYGSTFNHFFSTSKTLKVNGLEKVDEG